MVGCHSTKGKVIGSIPGQGIYWGCRFGPSRDAYERQRIDVSVSCRCFFCSLSPSLSISLKINKYNLFNFLKILFIFREEGREKEREGNINVWLPLLCPLLGTWPTTQACALTGNRTSNPLVLRPVLNPLSYTSQGQIKSFLKRERESFSELGIFKNST